MFVNISGLLELVGEIPSFSRLLEQLKQGGEVETEIIDAAKSYLLASLWREVKGPIVLITSREERARQLQDQLLAWLGDEAAVYLFPEPDALPYERLSSDTSTTYQRMRVLSYLAQSKESGTGSSIQSPVFVVASVHSVMRKTLSFADFAAASYSLHVGDQVSPDKLADRLIKSGYEPDNVVELPGTFSRRGGILDVYTPPKEMPLRIEFFGDEIESLRLFDPATQRSTEKLDMATISPAREILTAGKEQEIESHLASLDLSLCTEGTRERMMEEFRKLRQGQPFEASELYSGLFNDGSLLDYLSDDTLLITDEPSLVEMAVKELANQSEEFRKTQEEHGSLPQNFPRPYFDWIELAPRLESVNRRLSLVEWSTERHAGKHFVMPFVPAPSYSGQLRLALRELDELLRNKGRMVIISQQARRLSELLAEHEIIVSPQQSLEELPQRGALRLVEGSLPEGWDVKDEHNSGHPGFILLTDAEIFGFTKQRRAVKKRTPAPDFSLSDLSPGDYIVHVEHGIARFAGMVTLNRDGVERDYLTLEYAAGDRLFVPTEQIDRISRYIGPGGHLPALSRLDTQDWTRAKEKVKRSVKDLAEDLLALYSAREVLPGISFSPDTVWQEELEASFPYIETPDQLSTIKDVKLDMESPKPMDRLVCGDVGYGKTEVAARAAFKAVMDGMQVAVLVPTTVLAQQHFLTFGQRLSAFPIKVEMLSRFRSNKEQKEILKGLREGSIDIVIGTHRLLQKDVEFKNLGLVVIDEEQRFGVAHKERLKQMRKEVDVLTLTATPIPRTLHMSLVGVRDMSTIETPPEQRLPVKTYLGDYDEGLIRETILREMERGGQVFFVHNRVQDIGRVAKKLSDLVPEAKILVGHGQMPEEQLEKVMLDFAAGKADILVCTTIIESGLDMPNVNTIIITQADKFGLAQLYQLRGRVGRGINRAYAYLFFDRDKTLTETAEKRLRAVFEATELGAGFRIAMKDMEIRGAGNLLGAEQSGYISAVGFDLYCRLLAEAVEELKAKRLAETLTVEQRMAAMTSRPASPTIDLSLPARLPEDYVSDVGTRLAFYQRLAKMESLAEVEELEKDLMDRFGPLPISAANLLYMMRIKLLAKEGGVQSIYSENGHIVLQLTDTVPLDKLDVMRSYGQGIKLGTSQIRLFPGRLGSKWQRTLEEILMKIQGAKELVSVG